MIGLATAVVLALVAAIIGYVIGRTHEAIARESAQLEEMYHALRVERRRRGE